MVWQHLKRCKTAMPTVSGFTHLGNAMAPLSRKNRVCSGLPSPDATAWAGLIADGHCHLPSYALFSTTPSAEVSAFLVSDDAHSRIRAAEFQPVWYPRSQTGAHPRTDEECYQAHPMWPPACASTTTTPTPRRSLAHDVIPRSVYRPGSHLRI